MLLVILPGADILRSVGVRVGPVAVSLVVDPVTLVNVAISMVEPAATVGFASTPLALIAATIEPRLLALAIADPIEPFAFIDGA